MTHGETGQWETLVRNRKKRGEREAGHSSASCSHPIWLGSFKSIINQENAVLMEALSCLTLSFSDNSNLHQLHYTYACARARAHTHTHTHKIMDSKNNRESMVLLNTAKDL